MPGKHYELTDKEIRERMRLILPFGSSSSQYQTFVNAVTSVMRGAGLKMCVAHWPEEEVVAVIPFDASLKKPSNNDIIRSFRAAKAIPLGAASTVQLAG